MGILAALLALHLAPVSPAGPNRQPQLAAGDGMVALVFGSGQGIWLAQSHDNARSFSAPVRVAELPKLLLGRHRGPRVVISHGVIIVSAIASEPGDLVSWRSTDAGKTWTGPQTINDRPTAAREGLHAMAGDAAGHLAAVWLDDRIGPKGKRLWGAFSDDAGATWSKNVMLYESPSGTICECCHPSLAVSAPGEFVVMWRNAVAGSRDLYMMRLRGGASAGPAEKIGGGTWKLDACPMDGGGIVSRQGRITTAWRRGSDVFYTEAGGPEMKLAAGHDVAVAVNNQGAYVAWVTPEGVEMHFPHSDSVVKLAGGGSFPVLLTLPDEAILAAWEENGSIATTRF